MKVIKKITSDKDFDEDTENSMKNEIKNFIEEMFKHKKRIIIMIYEREKADEDGDDIVACHSSSGFTFRENIQLTGEILQKTFKEHYIERYGKDNL